MSQMLLPLSNLAAEIMDEWKGRLRAVDVYYVQDDAEEAEDGEVEAELELALTWQDVPYMKELLRRLKSILRRKPDVDESTGIRPLLLDLQGVPRHGQDHIDSSIEMPFYPPADSKLSLFERFTTSEKSGENEQDEWFHLEKFLAEVGKLLQLLSIPNIPFLVEERMAGKRGDKNTLLDLIAQCTEMWDEEMFKAQYKDWFDMVKRQQELNAGGAEFKSAAFKRGDGTYTIGTSLPDLSKEIREVEIELSIAMASKDQLERVHKRLEALRADKEARYRVLAQIVLDVGDRKSVV